MKSEEMVKELWSLANVIAGFSVAQSLAFALALGKDLGGLQSKSIGFKQVLVAFCFLFGAAYSLAIFRCQDLALSLTSRDFENPHEAIWNQVTMGRVIAVWLFTAIPIFGLFAPNLEHQWERR